MVRCTNSRGLHASFRQSLRLSQLQSSAASPAAFSTSLGNGRGPPFSRCRRPVLPSLDDALRTTWRCFSLVNAGDDTIYALSSASGKAGIAVIRVSGPACKDIYAGLCPSKAIPKPRFAGVRTLVHPEASPQNVVDSDAVVLSFPGPKTVTGDDVLELHIHGGNATVKAVLSAIQACRSASTIRYAEPGEFTKRAFLNNRLDLAQVESLSETLSAETEQQRRAAVLGSSGALGRTYEEWRQKLLLARAEIEAIIDFSEDQHFDESPKELLTNVSRLIEEILESIDLHEMASQRSELLRNGIRIALVGPPNAGKSSLMNQIVGREASIVSGEAGTTRDIVEAHLDIRGYLCTFADTAGFRSDNDLSGSPENSIGAVEQEGIRRARAKALESDVVVVLASIEKDSSGCHMISYDQETIGLLRKVGKGIVIINKRDVLAKDDMETLVDEFKVSVLDKVNGVALAPTLVSCKQAESRIDADAGGLHGLVDKLISLFSEMTSLPATQQDLHGVTQRQRQLLIQCRTHLEDYVGNTASGGDSDEPNELNFMVAAEDLRYAANCLARITGRGETGNIEEVLGVIFEKFCVGK